MDKKQIAHEIALISAKACCDSSSDKSNVKAYAYDMTTYYLEACATAEEILSSKKSDGIQVLK